MRFCRVLGLFTVFGLLLALASHDVSAQTAVIFPWGGASGKHQPAPYSGTPPVYRTLGKLDGHNVTPQPEVLVPYPQQQAYAYGWFGSNPAPIWGRHFGYSKSYTQWTQR